MPLNNASTTLPEIWATHARFSGRKTAAICGEQRMTWRELGASMSQVANALAANGIGKGHSAALLASNSLDMLRIMCGIVRSGACMVPISTMLVQEQVAAMLADSSPSVVFVSQSARHLVEPPHSTSTRLHVAIDFEAPGWTTFAELLKGAPDAEPVVQISADDDYNIIYSSGTTGVPKGIVQTHRARFHWSYSNAIEMGFSSQSVSLVTTALYSNGTMFMVLPPLFTGGTIVIMEKYSPVEALDLIALHKVSHVFMVPSQAIMTLEQPEAGASDLSSLRMWLSGGSALRPDTRERILSELTPYVYELYGFSEGFASIRKPWDAPARAGSVGRPIVGFDMRIIDDAGSVLDCGEPGEIAGYGEGMMRGYHNNPDATEEMIWRSDDGRSFLRSGDIGMVDEDGFLYVLERKKDMIVSGGFNVFPADIEAVVARHSAVQDVTVIGVPHAKWGETPLALVIARGTTTTEEILEWSNARLAKTQRLSGVELRDEFPRNALGKVLKRELRHPYWRGNTQ